MVAEKRISLDNATVLDVVGGRLVPNQRVVVKGARIERVEAMQTNPATGEASLDIQGKTLMPGLCDAHVHVTAWTANLTELMRTSTFYSAARATEILEGMLMRGF